MQRDEGEFLRGPEDHFLRDPGQVHANHGRDPGELGEDVAGGGAVDRVVRRREEAEVGGDGLRVQAQRGARQGSRAVGRNAGALVPVLEPLHVAQQRPGVGQQVVAEQDRLGMLQVGAAGHGHPLVRLGLVHQRVDRGEHAAGDDPGVVAQEHPSQRGHLVVAGPAGAELAAELGARALDQAALQGTVHVLIRLRRQVGAGGDVLVQLRQGRKHALEFGVVQQTGLVQHAGVRLGPGDVVAGQPPVKVRGLAQCGEGVRGATGEPAAPQRARISRLRLLLSHGGYCPATRMSRPEATLADMPHSSMKPRAIDWSKVSPVSYVARSKS